MLIIKHLKLHIPTNIDNARLQSQLIKRLENLHVTYIQKEYNTGIHSN